MSGLIDTANLKYDIYLSLIKLPLYCRFGPNQGSRSRGVIGVYCAFLALDVTAFRRAENISIISIFPRGANLQQVLNAVSTQLVVLARGIKVLDFQRACADANVDAKEEKNFLRTSTNLRVPLKDVVPRAANSLGDAVEQAVIAGHRTLKSIFFCRCCFGNQAGGIYEGSVYQLHEDILRYDVSKDFIIYIMQL